MTETVLVKGGAEHVAPSAHLGLQQRSACPATSSERACSSAEAAFSSSKPPGGPDGGICVASTLAGSPQARGQPALMPCTTVSCKHVHVTLELHAKKRGRNARGSILLHSGANWLRPQSRLLGLAPSLDEVGPAPESCAPPVQHAAHGGLHNGQVMRKVALYVAGLRHKTRPGCTVLEPCPRLLPAPVLQGTTAAQATARIACAASCCTACCTFLFFVELRAW